MTTAKRDILELLENKSLIGEELKREIGLSHERLYMALVQLESQGAIEVIPTYHYQKRTVCVWRNCEVLR